MSDAGNRRILAGRYEVGEFIGQGGMSTVYRGTDTKLGRPVAIKIMKADLANDSDFRQRFRQEAQAASRMAHPSIVRVYDAGDAPIQSSGETRRLPFIIMEYVTGKNLRQVVSEQPLTLTEATRVLDAVLTALEYSHRAGIVHRDIKPANIMITDTGQVKVMDFGIARAVSETSSTVQQTTAILGTAAYFSPEQAKGETVDARSDLYSAGVVLYELLTGMVPFRGDTAVAVAYQHVSERPQPPSSVKEDVPEAYDRVVLHALAKDRARRFQNAVEFKAALQQAREGVVPELELDDGVTEVAYGGDVDASDSDFAMRQLTATGNSSRSGPRPPVIWVWVAVLAVIAVLGAVVFWFFNLAPPEITNNNARTIPELTNVQREDALATLRDLDLIPVPIEESHDEIESGEVIRTSPAEGVTIDAGSTVSVYVSTGPPTVEVPDFFRRDLEDTKASIEDLGLEVGNTSTVDDPVVPGGSVISTNPEKGTRVTAGTEVHLTVSSGKVVVPDVRGQAIRAALTMLEPTRLEIDEVPDMSCEAKENLPIAGQSHVGQTEHGTVIEIQYCAG